jgi:hypothetical protein
MKRKSLVAASSLDLEFEGGLTEQATAHAGVAVLVEVMRSSGVLTVADRVLPAKKNPKGLSHGQLVESIIVLTALGGECMDDMEILRRDLGLRAILGYEPPAPSTLRSWLESFHDEAALVARPLQGAFIPAETPPLAALRTVLNHAIRSYVSAMGADRLVTIDVDAHIVESSKAQALSTYLGPRGYQPLLAVWVETGLILAEQFRDGNVPASVGIAELADAAAAALPARDGGWQIQLRSDTAGYEEKNLLHWDGLGWRFAVGADMTPQLRQAVGELPPDDWHLWAEEPGGFVREWAEVPFVPSRKAERRDSRPFRFLAIRIRPPQGCLFSDGVAMKLFAVVTNDWDTPGQALLVWQRGRAGSVEHTHRMLKDELAAGVYPSGKFGANAAWLRLQALTHNALEMLKAGALDPEYRQARPKRLRFTIFNHVGVMVADAGRLLMRVINLALARVILPIRKSVRSRVWLTA